MEVGRLRLLADGVVDLADREEAGYAVAVLESVLGLERMPAPSVAVLVADAAYAHATAGGGTGAERIRPR